MNWKQEYPERVESQNDHKHIRVGVVHQFSQNSNIYAHILHLEQDRGREEIDKPYQKHKKLDLDSKITEDCNKNFRTLESFVIVEFSESSKHAMSHMQWKF
jgi:hypothetical protein